MSACRVGAAFVVLLASGCSATPPLTSPSASPTISVGAPQQIDCNVIGETAPVKGWTVVAGVVALAVTPKTELLSLVDSQDAADEGMHLWTKTPIYVRPGTAWTLRVDGASADHVRMGWGSPAEPATIVVPPTCPDRPSSASDWWVFPGGFWVDRPGCYTVRLETDGDSTLLRVPLGERC